MGQKMDNALTDLVWKKSYRPTVRDFFENFLQSQSRGGSLKGARVDGYIPYCAEETRCRKN